MHRMVEKGRNTRKRKMWLLILFIFVYLNQTLHENWSDWQRYWFIVKLSFKLSVRFFLQNLKGMSDLNGKLFDIYFNEIMLRAT